MARRAATTSTTTDELILSAEDLATLATLLRKLIGSTAGAPAAPAEEAEPEEPAAEEDDGLGLDGEDEEPAGPTLDDVREKMKAVIAAKGRDTVAKILAKFGASKLPDLDEEKFADAIALADKVLAKK